MTSTLYLHVGQYKTGSSYIQSSLAKSTDLLQQKNIYYPITEKARASAAEGKISTGNGILLANPNFSSTLKKCKTINSESLLFSFEALYNHISNPSSEIHRNILMLIDQLKIQKIEILIFIRNPSEMISSLYHQGVKRHGWTLELEEYGNFFLNDHVIVLNFFKMISQWKNTKVTVFNYSYVKDSLLSLFQHWLTLDTPLLTPDIQIVNRSLTMSELELLKNINKITGAHSSKFSDQLCEKLPHIKSDSDSLPLESIESTLDKIYPVICEINSFVPQEHKLIIHKRIAHADDMTYTFSREQLNLLGEIIGQEILKSYTLQQSILYKISQKLNKFPRIKSILKTIILSLLNLYKKWVPLRF